MSTRKRQRPSARDFFDFPTPITESIQEPAQPSALLVDFQKPLVKQETLNEYYSNLVTLDPSDRIFELIRGRDNLLDSDKHKAFVFVLKSKNSYDQFPISINQILQPSHIARILWGPGKKQVAHAKTIYLGPLLFSIDDSKTLTTEEVYGIQFSDQRSADLATDIIEFNLNQFFLSENKNFIVEVKSGSSRWFLKDKSKSMDQFDWKIEKTKIPFLRPLPSLKPDSTDDPDHPHDDTIIQVEPRLDQSLAFEISQLPKIINIPILMSNLIKFGLIDFPIQIKLTEETSTDCPIRILLKFSNSISTMICKLSLFHCGLNSQPDQQNNDDTKVVQFIIDEGDSSIDDSWNIWKSALVWDKQSIEEFIKSQESIKPEESDHKQEEKIDQLADEKPDGFGSDEFEEWASSHPTGKGAEEKTNQPRRIRTTASYRQKLDVNEKEWERQLERLTLLADEEYSHNKAHLNSTKIKTSNANSAFYQVSQGVLEDKQYNNLMKLIKTRSTRRKLNKEYRKFKPLPKKIKRQRRAWKSGDREPNESDEGNTEEDEEREDESDESQSDGPDERQRASFTEQQWKRFRAKKRSKRLLDPSLSSEDDDDLVSKYLLTNDQIYQRKFARPNEHLPGDIN